MNLTIRLLGAEVLHLSTDPQPADSDLSGGTLDGRSIEASAGDLHLGFTNGREVEP